MSFETDSPIDLAYPTELEDSLFPNLYIGLEAGLFAPRDGIVTDRHRASAGCDEADGPQNQITGHIPPFALSDWLRHGWEAVYDPAQSATKTMADKDKLWVSECRAAFSKACQARLATSNANVAMPGDAA